jgi:putative oxidoreductase
MKTCIKKPSTPQPAIILLILRITFAIVVWPHGAQLLLGAFMGQDPPVAISGRSGLAAVIGLLVIVLEFFGSLLILSGTFTRPVAAASILLFLGMIFTGHTQCATALSGGNLEYHLLLIGILLCLALSGGGRYSVDTIISRKMPTARPH